MSFTEILILALALAMDAFSVAIMTGVKGCCSYKQMLRMSVTFAFFQFMMPIIGWVLAIQFYDVIVSLDHWIAFTLLAFVGGKMLWEAKGDQHTLQDDPTKGLTLLLLAIATSIDALAVGISLAALSVSIFWSSVVIGIVCFVMTVLGMRLSYMLVRNRDDISKFANIFGGLILIAIGMKILFEHGVFD